jgi:hypothetical protein
VKTFTQAMKEYFGLPNGRTISDFARELKELSTEEKKEFYELLVGAGVECSPPYSAAVQQ